MNDFIINRLFNKKLSYSVMIFLMICIFYISIEHVIDLTKFVFKYSSAFNYGKFIKKVCMKEYFEAETERFQVLLDSPYIKLENTSNHKRYMLFILIISIIISLYISLVFSYIIMNTFMNTSWINSILGNQTSNSDLSNILKGIFMFPKYIAYDIFWKNNSKFSRTTSTMFALFLLIVYFISMCSLVVLPIYIGLKLNQNIDISPFNENKDIYNGFIVAFVAIIVIRLMFKLKTSQTERDQKGILPTIADYLSNENERLYVGYIVFFSIVSVYICMYYVLGNVIHLYNKSLKQEQPKYDDMKEISLKTLMYDIYGINEFNNYEVPYIFVKRISGILFTLGVILIVIIAMLLILKSKFSKNERNLLTYGMILPLLCLSIIILSVSSVSEYNTLVNNKFIDSPSNLYKQFIKKANSIFNNFLSHDYTRVVSGPRYVCKNLGNGILLVLYSSLLKNTDSILGSDEKSDTSSELNFIPEFQYDASCDGNNTFDFSNSKEYDSKYLFNGKSRNKNVFYYFNKCSVVNNEFFTEITNNLKVGSPDLSSLTEKDDLETIKQKLARDSVFMQEIQKKKNDLKGYIYFAIKNISSGYTFDSDSKKILYDKNFGYNNTLSRLETPHGDSIDIVYKSIVEEVVDEYMELVYYNYMAEKQSGGDKTEHVKKLHPAILKTFARINTLLGTPLTKSTSKISQYIITNYNSLNQENVYIDSTFKVSTYNPEDSTEIDIGIFLEIVIEMQEIVVNMSNGKTDNSIQEISHIQSRLKHLKDKNPEFIKNIEKIDPLLYSSFENYLSKTKNNENVSIEVFDKMQKQIKEYQNKSREAQNAIPSFFKKEYSDKISQQILDVDRMIYSLPVNIIVSISLSYLIMLLSIDNE